MGMCMPAAMEDKGPRYPYGLTICLTDAELEKLNLKADCDVGDAVDLRCFGVVTSVSKNQRSDGTNSSRVEIQIQKLALQDDLMDDEPRGRGRDR